MDYVKKLCAGSFGFKSPGNTPKVLRILIFSLGRKLNEYTTRYLLAFNLIQFNRFSKDEDSLVMARSFVEFVPVLC